MSEHPFSLPYWETQTFFFFLLSYRARHWLWYLALLRAEKKKWKEKRHSVCDFCIGSLVYCDLYNICILIYNFQNLLCKAHLSKFSLLNWVPKNIHKFSEILPAWSDNRRKCTGRMWLSIYFPRHELQSFSIEFKTLPNCFVHSLN